MDEQETTDLSGRLAGTQVQRVRYLAGQRSGGMIDGAAMCLILPDERTIPEISAYPSDTSALSGLNGSLQRFLRLLLGRSYVTYVAIAARGGTMVIMMYLLEGGANPGLALLNLLRTIGKDDMISGDELAKSAGIPPNDENVPRPDNRTPQGCMVADKLEEFLLAAVNALLERPDRIPLA